MEGNSTQSGMSGRGVECEGVGEGGSLQLSRKINSTGLGAHCCWATCRTRENDLNQHHHIILSTDPKMGLFPLLDSPASGTYLLGRGWWRGLTAAVGQSAEDVALRHLEAHSHRWDAGNGGWQTSHICLHVTQKLLQLLQN